MTETALNTFGINIIPENDEERLEALRRYQILDTPPEETFTNLAHLIANYFDTPIALISLVDKDRVQFKGNVGMPGVKSVERGVSLCSLAVLSAEPTIIEEPLEDPCLLSNPLVHGKFGLRFYAGAPLITSDGFNIGTVCIVDRKERTFSQKDKDQLVRFAKVAMHDIELRLAAKKQREAEEELTRTQNQLYAALKVGKVTPWHWDIVNNKVFGGPELAVMFAMDHKQAAQGLSVEEFASSIHPEDQPHVWSNINASLHTGQEYAAEFRIITLDHEIRWVIGRGTVEYDENKKPISLTGITIDITESKKAEQEIRAKNEELSKLSQELHFVTNMMPQLVWVTEPDGYSYFFNKGWLDYTGSSLDEAKGDGWTKSLHPDDFDRTVTAWRRAVETAAAYDVEYRLKRWDGEYRWFVARGVPMEDSAGNILKWYGTSTDINDQKGIAEALRQSHERFGLVAKATQDAIWDWNLLTNKIWWNEGFRSLFGYKEEEIEPTIVSWYSRVHPDDKERVVNGIHQVIDAGGKQWSDEYRFRKADGSYVIVYDRGYALHNENGQPYRMLGSMQDITERKAASAVLEQRVKERTRELEKRNKELEQFTYVSHHDLQEPLRKIVMFSDLVRTEASEKLSETSLKRLDKVTDAAQRMRTALRDVLDFASLNKQEQFSLTNLDEVLASVQIDLEMLIQEKGARIYTTPLPAIQAIPQQMHQLFYNLLNNSFKFARTDVPPVVDITCKKVSSADIINHPELDHEKSYCEIAIQDNGIGFDQAASEKIFGMFQRLHTKAAYPGTGIGLALCKKVVLNHGGKIWAESVPDAGARFIIILPA